MLSIWSITSDAFTQISNDFSSELNINFSRDDPKSRNERQQPVHVLAVVILP